MVRLKSRYILFEILYPPSGTRLNNELPNFNSLHDIVMYHHQTSPDYITYKTILQELKKVIHTNFGDYGLGKATTLLQIKYFSNRTSTGIIRCSRDDYEFIMMAFCLMKKIHKAEEIIINPVKVSGTIKKLEQFAIRRNKKLLTILNQKDYIDIFTNANDMEVRD